MNWSTGHNTAAYPIHTEEPKTLQPQRLPPGRVAGRHDYYADTARLEAVLEAPRPEVHHGRGQLPDIATTVIQIHTVLKLGLIGATAI